MRRLLLALLLLSACREGGAPAAPSRAILHDGGGFLCEIPPGWTPVPVAAGSGPALLLAGPGQASIRVARYPNGVDRVSTPRGYWRALAAAGLKPSPLASRALGGRRALATGFAGAVIAPHARGAPGVVRMEVILVPDREGFFELAHAAPPEAAQAGRQAFESFAAGFRVK